MRLPAAARSLKRLYFLELGMSMMVPHNLSILSMTKVNIGQIGGKKFVNSRCCRLLFIYDTFGETSVELEVGQPYSTAGPSEPGEGGGCPPEFLEIISYSCFNQKVWGSLPPATLCPPPHCSKGPFTLYFWRLFLKCFKTL